MVTHEATPLVPGVGSPTDPNTLYTTPHHVTPHTATPELLLESEDMDAVVIGNKIVAKRGVEPEPGTGGSNRRVSAGEAAQ